ncbi:MAG: hypothetical protein J7L15_04535 [Clostridiales bacterium]|nr:hypothetical protein [Clostridiales bacterium]
MKHERDKIAILNSMFGYATHKNITPDEFFNQSQKLKTSKDIKDLNKRQGKLVFEDSLSKVWKPDS